jgi:hypothetical protein
MVPDTDISSKPPARPLPISCLNYAAEDDREPVQVPETTVDANCTDGTPTKENSDTVDRGNIEGRIAIENDQ